MPPGIAREDFGVHRSGKIVLERRPLDLAGLVGTGLDTFRAAGRFDRHHVTQDLQSCWGEGDPTRLEQVTSNLLDNAINYTPPGRQDPRCASEQG